MAEPRTKKDVITTVAALLVLVGTATQQGLSASAGNDIDVFAIVAAVAIAVIGYFTGKK